MKKCAKKTTACRSKKSVATAEKKPVAKKPANAAFACVPESLCANADLSEEAFLFSLEEEMKKTPPAKKKLKSPK